MADRHRLLLAVSGSIAVYKALDLTSRLVKHEIPLHIMMTESAAKLVSPLAFSALTGDRVYVDQWAGEGPDGQPAMPHIPLADEAKLVAIVPATYNVLGKLAHGLADDLVTTTLAMLPGSIPRLLAPAMNGHMYTNPVNQRNLATLKADGWQELAPDEGRLACGYEGRGKLASVDRLEEVLLRAWRTPPIRDLQGLRILITAGGTQESIDPVRYIGNRSSGKMGVALAEAARDRGADVTFIHAHMDVPPPSGVNVVSARDTRSLLAAVQMHHEASQVVMMAAAIADYTVENPLTTKRGKDSVPWQLDLTPAPDILKTILPQKGDRLHIGFAAETGIDAERIVQKCRSKGLNLLVVNDVADTTIGFGSDQNRVGLLTPDGVIDYTEVLPKRDIAEFIMNAVRTLRENPNP